VLAARKTYLITARARKNKRTARMLATARTDHSIPLNKSPLSESSVVLSLYGDFKVKPEGTLNLVRRVKSAAQVALTKEEVAEEFPDVFTGLGCTAGSYHIELDDTVQPVTHPLRRMPYRLLEKPTKKLEELEEKDFIQKLDRPTLWFNSLVIVEKRDGLARLCLDLRDLDKASRRKYHRIQLDGIIFVNLFIMILLIIY